MGTKSFLNIKAHLEHIDQVATLYEEHGDCPLFKTELGKIACFNRQILNRANKAQQNNRKNLYLNKRS